MIGFVNNQGYTLAQANQHFLDLLNKGNATLTNLEKVGRDCSVAKEECTIAQQEHAKELEELTKRVEKLNAVFKKLVTSST